MQRVVRNERRIEVYRRPQGRGHWQCEVARQGETVTMQGQVFRVDDVYDE
ncbi:hypothetical protein BH11MYX4_BH11MYX4_26390 [soil metagenome]